MIVSFFRKASGSVKYRSSQMLRNLSFKYVPLQRKTRSGLKIKIESEADWIIYNDIFVDQEYDLPIQQTIESASGERLLHFLDIGANVGFFSLRVADLISKNKQAPEIDFRITAIEGSPSTYYQLFSRLKNEPDLSNKLQLVNGLVGKRFGDGRIFENNLHLMSSVFSGSSLGTVVPYVDIQSLYDDTIEIDLLKCDIEGAELSFLENYSNLLLQVKRAVFEFHHDVYSPSSCIDILKDLGFLYHIETSRAQATSVHFFWK